MQYLMKTRFCPSPTGYMHIGNVRTALFNVLAVKAHQGKFLLRIEDTDLERNKRIYTESLVEDLKWLHLDWDEGIEAGGEHAPYYQSERQKYYEGIYKALLENGYAYHCFCTEAELKLSRKRQLASGMPPKYSGHCRNLSNDELAQKLEQNIPAVLRFHVLEGEPIQFTDAVRGELSFERQGIGDFIIRRSSGMPSFMFANAVDDSLMGVTHVIRGEDHLTNTPRQRLILQALQMRMPQYAHISMICGDDGAPLSKRNGSQSVRDLREQGYLASAILNYLARLGHYYPESEYMELEALSVAFDFEKLVKAPARFDMRQLNTWQHLAILNMDDSSFWQGLSHESQSSVPHESQSDFCQMIKPNIMFLYEAERWVKTVFTNDWHYDDVVLGSIKNIDTAFFDSMIRILSEHGCDYSKLCNELKSSYHLKGKQLFLPLRIALTGVSQGPELAKLLPLIGIDRSIERIKRLISALS